MIKQIDIKIACLLILNPATFHTIYLYLVQHGAITG